MKLHIAATAILVCASTDPIIAKEDTNAAGRLSTKREHRSLYYSSNTESGDGESPATIFHTQQATRPSAQTAPAASGGQSTGQGQSGFIGLGQPPSDFSGFSDSTGASFDEFGQGGDFLAGPGGDPEFDGFAPGVGGSFPSPDQGYLPHEESFGGSQGDLASGGGTSGGAGFGSDGPSFHGDGYGDGFEGSGTSPNQGGGAGFGSDGPSFHGYGFGGSGPAPNQGGFAPNEQEFAGPQDFFFEDRPRGEGFGPDGSFGVEDGFDGGSEFIGAGPPFDQGFVSNQEDFGPPGFFPDEGADGAGFGFDGPFENFGNSNQFVDPRPQPQPRPRPGANRPEPVAQENNLRPQNFFPDGGRGGVDFGFGGPSFFEDAPGFGPSGGGGFVANFRSGGRPEPVLQPVFVDRCGVRGGCGGVAFRTGGKGKGGKGKSGGAARHGYGFRTGGGGKGKGKGKGGKR